MGKWKNRISSFLDGDSRVLLMRLLSRFHCTLVAALGIAAVYDFLHWDAGGAYLRALLFCIPTALSYYAAKHVPALWQYLPLGLAITALSWLLLGNWGGLVLGFLICFFRGYARLTDDVTRSIFDAPHPLLFLYFAALFLLSAINDLHQLQRLTVISAVLYLLIYLSFTGLERLEEYLVLNKDMAGLPLRRIQRIAGSALLASLVLTAVLLLPPAAGFSGNVHMELPERRPVAARPTPTPEPDAATQAPTGGMGMDLSGLFGDEDPPRIPDWLDYLLFAVAISAAAGLLAYGIYRIFKNFRYTYTDSRDVVQFLAGKDRDEASDTSEPRLKLPRFLDRSPNALIRRQYRKQILRAAEEPPKRWQTPAEIEAEAGLDEPILHDLYEKARYGPILCTQDDVRTLRNSQKRKT